MLFQYSGITGLFHVDLIFRKITELDYSVLIFRKYRTHFVLIFRIITGLVYAEPIFKNLGHFHVYLILRIIIGRLRKSGGHKIDLISLSLKNFS